MQKKYIDIAYSKAKRLEKLIEDLFGFTKMNYGRLSMHVSQVDIIKLLGQLLEDPIRILQIRDFLTSCRAMFRPKVITADGNLLARLLTT